MNNYWDLMQLCICRFALRFFLPLILPTASTTSASFHAFSIVVWRFIWYALSPLPSLPSCSNFLLSSTAPFIQLNLIQIALRVLRTMQVDTNCVQVTLANEVNEEEPAVPELEDDQSSVYHSQSGLHWPDIMTLGRESSSS
ncbi:hypothetical protein Y032_0058g2905 [Ancylostoma ceylanicum]|uniref:Uncharacterized protein n=1 Tax=Ancylostoma ceylanicum TaxID=53326 RepID=A0A016U475_9BILA|nr:hypothetical protein Y032_0058g2905 [Ancylostoma ceylanicum]